jgi:P-type Ca2+ transporter type 2C
VAVPGRARLRVEGLRGKPPSAFYLRERIARQPAVRHVEANAITGSVLILFDSAQLTIQELIRDVELHLAERGGPSVAPAGEGSPWHALPVPSVTERLQATPTSGLTSDEARARLSALGANRLPTPEPKSALTIVGGHLTSLPVLLLGGAAALAIVTAAPVDAAVILAVVAANTAVGYLTESRVERILASLQSALTPQALVRRDGEETMLPSTALVPGDAMVLKSGHDVVADGRLVESSGLAVDESALTGESVPVQKAASTICPPETGLPDRINMIHAGTIVVEGGGLAVITGTGSQTELGRVRALVAETATPPTPLERQLDRVGKTLVGVSLGLCGLTLTLGLLRGVPALEMIRTVISLAVAAVPEGLPAVATTTLAIGMHQMMKRGMLVRRLAAVESLGATTVICADKTGTLTENLMAVDSWSVGDREFRHRPAALMPNRTPVLTRAMVIGVLCNEAALENGNADIRGSSTEGALLTAALEAGIDYREERQRHPVLSLRPRTDDDSWMATIHADGPVRRLMAVKGAPEQVLARADRWLDTRGERPLGAAARRRILAANARLAARGLRVLGLAFRELHTTTEATYDRLVWVGLVGLADPIRSGVTQAIAACGTAGIRSVILTGDQAATAAAVHRELDLRGNGPGRVVEAGELATTNADDLRDLVRDADVFARVTPADKYQIVRALQASGNIVAMTGDGINDAAALRAADIGVAMGARGTDVARDVADVVLLDDDFGSIVQAVEQGRTIHTNIGKALRFLLSTNFSEILVTLGALGFGIARPMSAIQFLWINLLSDVAPALALAMERAEPDVMARPPRDPAQPILTRSALTEIAIDGSVLAAATLAVHSLAVARYGAGARATTVAFSTLTAAQLLHAFSYRSGATAGPGRLASPTLLGVVGGSLAVQLGTVMLPPLRRLLGTVPLSLSDWSLVAAGALAPLVLRAFR